MSLKDALQKASGRRYTTGTIPGLGESFRGQSLTTAEMRTFRQSFLNSKGEMIKSRGDRLSELLIAQFLVDDGGNRLYSDADIMAGGLDSVDGAVTAFLFSQAKAWTGFGNDDDWSAIENAAKN